MIAGKFVPFFVGWLVFSVLNSAMYNSPFCVN